MSHELDERCLNRWSASRPLRSPLRRPWQDHVETLLQKASENPLPSHALQERTLVRVRVSYPPRCGSGRNKDNQDQSNANPTRWLQVELVVATDEIVCCRPHLENQEREKRSQDPKKRVQARISLAES
jgi:hypothetical protein